MPFTQPHQDRTGIALSFLALFIPLSLMMTTLISVRLVEIGPLLLPSGVIYGPLITMSVAILYAVWGFRVCRNVVLSSIVLLALMAALVQITLWLPSASTGIALDQMAGITRFPRNVALGVGIIAISQFTCVTVLRTLERRQAIHELLTLNLFLATNAASSIGVTISLLTQWLGVLPFRVWVQLSLSRYSLFVLTYTILVWPAAAAVRWLRVPRDIPLIDVERAPLWKIWV